MKPKDIQQFLTTAVQTEGHPAIHLWGPPGVGKTMTVYGVGEALKAHVVVLIASTLNPEDVRGLPYPDWDKLLTHWLRPEEFPDPKSPDLWLVFFDELNLATPSSSTPATGLSWRRPPDCTSSRPGRSRSRLETGSKTGPAYVTCPRPWPTGSATSTLTWHSTTGQTGPTTTESQRR